VPEVRPADPRLDPEADAVAGLWRDYKSSAAGDARERLILHYSPLVKFVAGRVAAGLPQSIEQSDLVSYGIFGLIDAIDKFDPERGFKFETYAIARIKGAIIDELRSIDWVPRSVRAKARAIERAYGKLEHELRRTPDDSEVAGELGMTEEELAATLGQISFVGLVALDDVVGGGDEGAGTTVGDRSATVAFDPAASSSRRDERLLADPSPHVRPRALVYLYYTRAVPGENGDVLGVTESRVCI